MEKWVRDFFSDLHRNYLKQLGFTKVRHTFSRDLGGYWERINFQGSAWNCSNEPWKFYINIGIEFKDLPGRKGALTPHTHWARRLEEVLEEAPGYYEISVDKNENELAERITSRIREASQIMAADVHVIQSSYLANGHDR